MISSLGNLAPGNTFTVTTVNNEVFTGIYMQCTELGKSQFLCFSGNFKFYLNLLY